MILEQVKCELNRRLESKRPTAAANYFIQNILRTWVASIIGETIEIAGTIENWFWWKGLTGEK